MALLGLLYLREAETTIASSVLKTFFGPVLAVRLDLK